MGAAEAISPIPALRRRTRRLASSRCMSWRMYILTCLVFVVTMFNELGLCWVYRVLLLRSRLDVAADGKGKHADSALNGVHLKSSSTVIRKGTLEI
jgi:hypothetical protein